MRVASITLLLSACPGSSFLTNFPGHVVVQRLECNKMAAGGTDVEKKVEASDLTAVDPL
jgi:hypothetical protein